jgi:hypothetical protein
MIKTTILELVQDLIKIHETDAKKAQDKLNENYCFNFSWGYPEQLFKSIFVINYLEVLQTFIEEKGGQAELWLEHNVKVFTDTLLTRSLTEHSTGAFSNLAYSFELDMKQYLLKEFKMWLEFIKTGTPIK